MIINNINDLIDFIENNNFEIDEINKVTRATIKALFITSETKEDAVNSLKEYWKLYGSSECKPIFIDLDNPLNF